MERLTGTTSQRQSVAFFAELARRTIKNDDGLRRWGRRCGGDRDSGWWSLGRWWKSKRLGRRRHRVRHGRDRRLGHHWLGRRWRKSERLGRRRHRVRHGRDRRLGHHWLGRRWRKSERLGRRRHRVRHGRDRRLGHHWLCRRRQSEWNGRSDGRVFHRRNRCLFDDGLGRWTCAYGLAIAYLTLGVSLAGVASFTRVSALAVDAGLERRAIVVDPAADH